jgi:hypothetical protein
VSALSFAAAKALLDLNIPPGEEITIEVLGRKNKTSSSFIPQQKRDAMPLFSLWALLSSHLTH